MPRSKPTHAMRGNVLDDPRFSPEKGHDLEAQGRPVQPILKPARKHSQKQLQETRAEPQRRVSEMLNREIANKSVHR